MYHINTKIDKPDMPYFKNRLNEMMKDGIRISPNAMDIYEELNESHKMIANSLKDNYGIANPNSPKQIIEFMQSLRDVTVAELAINEVTGKWSSSKQVMTYLSAMGYAWAKQILNYRRSKRYADVVKGLIEASKDDGLVHPTISVTKTNRLTYANPPILGIPKNILWQVIIPRKTGSKLFSADIKNQEPNIMINMLDAKKLKPALESDRGLYEELFSTVMVPSCPLNLIITSSCETPEGYLKNSDMANDEAIPPYYYSSRKPSMNTMYYHGEKVELIDPVNIVVHYGKDVKMPTCTKAKLASGEVVDIPVSFEITPTIKRKLNNPDSVIETTALLVDCEYRCVGVYRKEFKIAWNSLTYGGTLKGIQKMCKHIDAQRLYNFFTKEIPEIKEYREKCGSLANRGIQQIRTCFGTVLSADEYGSKLRLKRVLTDIPIQGTASDIMTLLIKNFDSEIKKAGLADDIKLYYTRIDEWIIEVTESCMERLGEDRVVEIIRDLMEHQVNDWIPFKVEIEQVNLEQKLDIEAIFEAGAEEEILEDM